MKSKKQKTGTIKLTLMAIVVFIMSVATVKAQSTDLTFGIKAGVSISTLKTGLNAVGDKSGNVGFNGGVFARVGDEWFFQPEVNYATFSNKYSYDAKSYDAKFNMINVPLMIGYKLINNQTLVLRISAGPDLYYDLKSTESPTGLDYKKVSAGIMNSVGVDLGNLTLDVRHSLGLSKINSDLGQKVNIFSLTVGFKFQ